VADQDKIISPTLTPVVAVESEMGPGGAAKTGRERQNIIVPKK
jgi:hypothetical protein